MEDGMVTFDIVYLRLYSRWTRAPQVMAVDTAGIPLLHQFNSVAGLTHCNWQIKHCNLSKHLYRSGTISLPFNSMFLDFKTSIVSKGNQATFQKWTPIFLAGFVYNRAQSMYCFENLEMTDTACVYPSFVEAKGETGIKIIRTWTLYKVMERHCWLCRKKKNFDCSIKTSNFNLFFQLKHIFSWHPIIGISVSKGKSHGNAQHSPFVNTKPTSIKTKWHKLPWSSITNWKKE